MARIELKKFFLERKEASIFNMLNSDELSLIRRFLSEKEKEHKEILATELMEQTLLNIDPDLPVFSRLFDTESRKLMAAEDASIHMKEDYRSHYIHSVNVYLLGFFLLQDNFLGKEFTKNLNLGYFDTHYEARPTYDNFVYSSGDESKEFQKRWALTAFFHDIAYLSEINLKVMQDEGKRLTGVLHPYSLEISDLQSFLTIYKLSAIKEKIKMSMAPDYLFCEDALELLAHRMVNRIGIFSKNLIYQSLKERIISGLKNGFIDHGLTGAIFVLQQFYSLLYSLFVETLKSPSEPLQYSVKYSINRNILRFTDAMTAISLHNIKTFNSGIFRRGLDVKIINHKLPLAFLLILADELQTWEREMAPPKKNSGLYSLKAIKKNRIDKNIFLNFFISFYQEYASLPINEHELVFFIPFLPKQKNDYKKTVEYILSGGEVPIRITFKNKLQYLLTQFLDNEIRSNENLDIYWKIFSDTEKETWKIFKKEHQTLGQFLELVVSWKNYLDKMCASQDQKEDNNQKVEAMKCLVEEILPSLILLKKGQDKLFSYLKPYHFHGIDADSTVDSTDKTNKNCVLRLHYPGKEVGDIEKVLKERMEKNIYGKDHKKIHLKYPNAPDTVLNRTINEYIEHIEKYIYNVQQGHFKVTRHKREEIDGTQETR